MSGYDRPAASRASFKACVQYLSQQAVLREAGYGNFDKKTNIILDQISRISQPNTTRRAPCNMLYFVPMLIGC